MTKFKNLICVLSLSLFSSAHAQLYDWSTIAGSVGNSVTADGVGTNASFANPQGIAVDASGNIFVADASDSVIREISLVNSNWQVATIAGSVGVPGIDDGTNALFSYPAGIAVDTAGNLYVADTGNSEIREIIQTNGAWFVKTLAGQAGYNLDRDGTNAFAGFRYPAGVAVDAVGNVYVADTQGYTIRKISPSGTNWVVTTLAGKAGANGPSDGTNGAARFQAPYGIVVGNDGTVFVADSGNCNIRKLRHSGTNWIVTTIAGSVASYSLADGVNLASQFSGPQGIAIDGFGNLFVADTLNNTIRKVSQQGTDWVTTTIAAGSQDPVNFLPAFAGSADGVGANAQFYSPGGICIAANGALYVSDSANYTIRLGATVGFVSPLGISYGGSQVTISWLAIAGKNYQLQYSPSLNPASWSDVGSPQQAVANAVISASDSTGGDAERFYRVEILP